MKWPDADVEICAELNKAPRDWRGIAAHSGAVIKQEKIEKGSGQLALGGVTGLSFTKSHRVSQRANVPLLLTKEQRNQKPSGSFNP